MRNPGHMLPSSPETMSLLNRAEKAGTNLPPLMIAANRIAMTVSQGIHGRRQVGQGESFWQFRRYQFGDSVHNIDWRQSGKSQRVYIRQNEWESAQSVWIDCDQSTSMSYTSSSHWPEKRERSAVLSLALASLLIRGDERVTLLHGGGVPSSSHAALHEMAQTLITGVAGGVGDADDVGPVTLPKNARLVIFSDFLCDPSVLSENLQHYVEQGVKGAMVRVIDPAEESLPYDGRVLFEGLEREGDALIERVDDIREEYQSHWHMHGQQLAEAARVANWPILSHHTDDSPENLLLQLYMLMSDNRVR